MLFLLGFALNFDTSGLAPARLRLAGAWLRRQYFNPSPAAPATSPPSPLPIKAGSMLASSAAASVAGAAAAAAEDAAARGPWCAATVMLDPENDRVRDAVWQSTAPPLMQSAGRVVPVYA